MLFYVQVLAKIVRYFYILYEPVLGIRDILVRIRVRIGLPESVPLTNGSGSGTGSGSNFGSTTFFMDFKDAKKNFLFFAKIFS